MIFVLILQTLLSTKVASVCDPTLWQHTYKPERLRVYSKCVSVTGIIVDATHGKRKDGVRKESDGDTHGWLKLDTKFVSMLNKGNKTHEQGNIVYEIVCHWQPTQKDALDACKNYVSPVLLAPIGSHVEITGSFVQDDNHAKWNEIHPVTSIRIIH